MLDELQTCMDEQLQLQGSSAAPEDNADSINSSPADDQILQSTSDSADSGSVAISIATASASASIGTPSTV